MNVMYDISVLGLGYYRPRSRTGIYRVVENLAYGLAASEDCRVDFCATASRQHTSLAMTYFQTLKANFPAASFMRPHFTTNEKIRNVIDRQIFILKNHMRQTAADTACKPDLKERILKKGTRACRFINRILAQLETSSSPLVDSNSLENADIFHSPYYAFPGEVKKLSTLKRFLTVHDLIPILSPHFFKSSSTHPIYHILDSLGGDDFVLCNSEATKQDLCNYVVRLHPSKVFVTHLAASDFFYPCRDGYEIKRVRKKYALPDGKYVLGLGTLEPRKNIAHTIECFAKLVQQQSLSDLSLVLVGTKGWDYKPIFEKVSHYENIGKRILFTGYVDDEDLAALYSGALVFVYPSFYEGFGLPPLEAMQCGVPVITSNTSSLPEVVGEAGIMLDPNDADGLCQAMLDLYQHPSLREEMSQKSLSRAAHFSWDKCAQETIAAYQTALKQ